MKEIEDVQLATTIITSFELFFGVIRGSSPKKEQRLNELQRVLSRLVIFHITHESAVLAAEILGNLYKIGKPIYALDCFIAAISLSHGCSSIITRNKKHFENIEGLSILEYK